jgi:pentatricopeptide repeat protein
VNLLNKMARSDELVVTTSTFNAVLSACAEGGELESLMQIWKVMKEKGSKEKESRPNIQTFSIVIEALCNAKQPNQASEIIVEMAEWGVPCTTDIFTQVVTSCERERQYRNALKVYAAMSDAGVKYYEIGVLDLALKRMLKVVKNIADFDFDVTDLLGL